MPVFDGSEQVGELNVWWTIVDDICGDDAIDPLLVKNAIPSVVFAPIIKDNLTTWTMGPLESYIFS